MDNLPDHHDNLKIKLGSWLEASANGRVAIAALVVILACAGAGRAFGVWRRETVVLHKS
jgi:hypothetical protein